MRRAEIDRKFDEIVEFAGIEQFLDTPVKRYSSGMQVRLGFAVAAHLEPEILFVDEVLAVGDADVPEEVPRQDDRDRSGRAGRSCSSPTACRRSCGSARERSCSTTAASSPPVRRTESCARTSNRTSAERANGAGTTPRRRLETRSPGYESIRVVPATAAGADEIDIREPIDIEVEYWSAAPGSLRPSVNLHFYNDEGVCLFVTNDTTDRSGGGDPDRPGVVRTTCRIPGQLPGRRAGHRDGRGEHDQPHGRPRDRRRRDRIPGRRSQ